MMVSVLAAVLEFQRDMISENTREGVAAAQAAGKTLGRPRRRSCRRACLRLCVMQLGYSPQRLRLLGTGPAPTGPVLSAVVFASLAVTGATRWEVVVTDRSRQAWLEALDRVRRERFVPEVVYERCRPDRLGNDFAAVSRASDPRRWWGLVRADAPVITQVDDGRPSAAGTGFEVTSSVSAPGIAVDMLEALDPAPDDSATRRVIVPGWPVLAAQPTRLKNIAPELVVETLPGTR